MVDTSEGNKLRVPFMANRRTANPWFRNCMVGFIPSLRGLGLHSLWRRHFLCCQLESAEWRNRHITDGENRCVALVGSPEACVSCCLVTFGLWFLQRLRPWMIQDSVSELLSSCCSRSISLHRIRCRTLSEAPCCALQHGFGTGLMSTDEHSERSS